MPPRKPTTGDVPATPATPATSKPSTKKPAAAKVVKAADPAPVAANAGKPAKPAAKKPAAKKAAKPADAVAAVETLSEALAVVSTPALAAAAVPASAEAPAAVLAFRTDWREDQQGALTAGGSVVLRYEPARLAAERAVEGVSPVAEVVGYARFLPGGRIDRTPLRHQAAGDAPFEAELPIPAEAREVELWFEGTDAAGATRWDSRFGANYRFGVSGRA